MPRNGSGVYSPPPAYNVQTGDTIQTSQYVPIIEDIQADLNAARPVSSGGTGATSKSGARDNLQVASKVIDKGANYTVSVDDRGQILRATASLTFTLPPVATAGNGFMIAVRGDGGGASVRPDGSETVDGGFSRFVDDGEFAFFYCNGVEWYSTINPNITANANVTNVAGDLVVEGSGNQTYRVDITGTGGVAETIIGVTSDLGGGNFRTLVLLSPDTNDATTPWRFNDPVTFDDLFLSGSQVFARSNILDPVSQSGGVPTGGIIESGSGSNGSYTKFADGTLECRHTLTTSASASVTWTYEEAFSAAPHVAATVRAASAAMATTQSIGVATADINAWNAAGARIANSVDVVARGRWF